MGNVSLPLGSSNSGTNDWADVNGEDQAIVDVVNGNIENVNIKSSAAIAYSKLASASTGQALIGNAGTPTMTTLSGDVTVGATGTMAIGATKVTAAMLNADTQSAYRTLMRSRGVVPADEAAGTFMLGTHSITSFVAGTDDGQMITSATSIGNATATTPTPPPDLIYFDDADYTVASLTQKLRLRAQVAANATAPGINFTFGLYPITVAGTADKLTFTLGTVVTDSTVALNTPSASTVTSGVNSDFAVPADGAYALGVVTSGTMTNNSIASVHAQLQQRSV